jgi:endonuclease/exonuclease/phosphatase family metal-dependent hydrolase
MDVTVGSFNLNNLFGRWNLFAEAPAARAAPGLEATPAATEPPRAWLEPAPALARHRTAAVRASSVPDVKIVLEGEVTETGIKWRTNPYDGRVVYRKTPEAQRTLAERIKAIDVDVLALQEVENIEALEEFVEEQALRDYRHRVLVEGNDERLIDVALLSKLPLGAVTSWRQRTYRNRAGERPIFSRDLLEVEILDERRRRVLFTLLNNHLKSKLARSEDEVREGNLRRQRQVETIAAIAEERRLGHRLVVLGDMNDTPVSRPLRGLRDLGLVDALTDPDESGGPYPPDDPTPPQTKAWTHRFRAEGRTDYELFDQIWLTTDLARRQTGAWIHRRTRRGGDASDHDPPYVSLRL